MNNVQRSTSDVNKGAAGGGAGSARCLSGRETVANRSHLNLLREESLSKNTSHGCDDPSRTPQIQTEEMMLILSPRIHSGIIAAVFQQQVLSAVFIEKCV